MAQWLLFVIKNVKMIKYENLRLLNQKIFDKYKESYNKFLQSGWFVLGRKVVKSEEGFAKFNDTKYCISVASGLDALILAIDTFNFPKASEIIIPSNNYYAINATKLETDLSLKANENFDSSIIKTAK